MFDNSQYREALGGASDAVVKWYREGEGYLNMREKINHCLDLSGANNAHDEESLKAHRKFVTDHILIYSLHGLQGEQIKEAEVLLTKIAVEEAPSISSGFHR